jgi:hypothetical protein
MVPPGLHGSSVYLKPYTENRVTAHCTRCVEKYHWHHKTVITSASKILARLTRFIFHCRTRAARRNVTTRSPHTPELEFLDEELIRACGKRHTGVPLPLWTPM